MLNYAEVLTELLLCKHVCPGVDALFIKGVKIDKMVADFIGRVAEHKYDLLGTSCDTLKTDGKSVTAKNREYNTDGLVTEFVLYILCYLVNRCVITHSTGNNCLCYGYYIPVSKLEALALRCCKYAVNYDLSYIIALFDDRCTYAS